MILVGEMRDLETIQLAVSAAETGHLVFGTLHTSSAAQTVDRMRSTVWAAELVCRVPKTRCPVSAALTAS